MTTVSVTERHLAEGIPGCCSDCPVALAVEDAFPHATDVAVGDRYISMYHDGQSVLLAVPGYVRELTRAIDRRETVKPFSFTLDYPAVTQ